ncbi:MAG: hypothetical protein K6G07_02380, partial [Lachnospiraceae bacterium]|nr:hypothetical protein [Lachnospiraceae bacterium]
MIKQKRFKRHIAKRLLAGALSVCLTLPACLGGMGSFLAPKTVEAKLAETQPITYEYYTRTLGNVVPASWLFVGTYLMSAKAVTAQVYQSALDSRDYYKQPIAFYTSELDNGEWKNVEGASSLTTILPVSGDVDEETLFPYLITVVVGDDGIPRDPQGGDIVDIFTPVSPYEMENIPELAALLEYYKNGDLSAKSEGTEGYLYGMLHDFFEEDNNEDFDRDSLDVAAAIEEYADLSTDAELLEDVWDDAMSTSPYVYPEEYKDIMLVMRNWPNIRDNVTDRADYEEELLNALYNELQKEKLNEEGDAALYVSRQIDATRRAEIYYNLLSNDNLTGSYVGDSSEAKEELKIRSGELDAELARLAVSVDRAEYTLTVSENAIKDLEKENASIDENVSAENERWDARVSEMKQVEGGDPTEAALAYLKQELADIMEEFAPIETEYNRLNTELDTAVNTSVEMNEEQTAIRAKIDARIADKDAKIAEYNAGIDALRAKVEELTAMIAEGKERQDEYVKKQEELEELAKKQEELDATLASEKEALAALITESEGYVSSRFSALFDADKTYDPKKKKDLESQIEAKNKVVASLQQLSESCTAQTKEAQAIVEDIASKMDLEDLLAEAEKSMALGVPAYEELIAKETYDCETETAKMQEELAALSAPYQEKLRNLQEKNDAYNAYEPKYLEELAKVNEKKAEISAFEEEIAAHKNTLSEYASEKSLNDELIKQKTAELPLWEAPVDAQNAKVDALVREREVLASLEAELDDNHLASALKARGRMWEQRYLTESAVLAAEKEKRDRMQKALVELEERAKEQKALWDELQAPNNVPFDEELQQRKNALYERYYGTEGVVTNLDTQLEAAKKDYEKQDFSLMKDAEYNAAEAERSRLARILSDTVKGNIEYSLRRCEYYQEKVDDAFLSLIRKRYLEYLDDEVSRTLCPYVQSYTGTQVEEDYQKCKEVFDKYVSEMEAAYETADALVKELNEKYLDKEKELQRKKE